MSYVSISLHAPWKWKLANASAAIEHFERRKLNQNFMEMCSWKSFECLFLQSWFSICSHLRFNLDCSLRWCIMIVSDDRRTLHNLIIVETDLTRHYFPSCCMRVLISLVNVKKIPKKWIDKHLTASALASEAKESDWAVAILSLSVIWIHLGDWDWVFPKVGFWLLWLL